MTPVQLAPFDNEAMRFIAWLGMISMIDPSRIGFTSSLVVDAMRFALGYPAENLSTFTRHCGVEIVAQALLVCESAPESMRPAMRQWIKRHEDQLDVDQSQFDKNWRLYAGSIQEWIKYGKTDF